MTTPTTAAVQVDRLSLHAGSMSEADARRLAELIALALGRLPASAKALDAGNVSVDLAPQAGRSLEQIADAVARQISAALRTEAVT
jgi:hypothetical protein